MGYDEEKELRNGRMGENWFTTVQEQANVTATKAKAGNETSPWTYLEDRKLGSMQD